MILITDWFAYEFLVAFTAQCSVGGTDNKLVGCITSEYCAVCILKSRSPGLARPQSSCYYWQLKRAAAEYHWTGIMIARLQWIFDISISVFSCCTMCDKEDNSPNSNFKISHHFLSYISIVCSKRRQWMYLKCIISHSRIWYRKLPHYPQSVRIIRSCSMQWRCAVRRVHATRLYSSPCLPPTQLT